MQLRISLLCALASAVLMALAQNYAWAGWIALVALVPLLLRLREGGLGYIWLCLVCFFSVSLSLSIFWIRLSGPGTIWLLPVSIVYSLLFLAIPAAAVAFARGAWVRLLLLAPAWMLAEVLGRCLLFRLNWTILGQPLADYAVMSQIAALAGPEALSLLAIAVNAGLALAILEWRRLRARSLDAWLMVAAPAAILVVSLAFGALQLGTSAGDGPVLRAGAVQPMNSQRLSWTPESRGPVLEKMSAMIERVAHRAPDLIVLPEWAVVGNLKYDGALAEFATQAVRHNGIPLLLGAGDSEGGRFYNAATLIGTDGRVFTYRKMRLIPFVEYTPRGVPFSPAAWIRFSPGEQATVFPLSPGVSIGVMICLEDTLPELAREFANGGATMLAALVNTADFAGTSESLQHLRRARLTAIAAGLPMLRVANSGISCALDSRGRVLAALPPERPETGILRLETSGQPTLYRWMGDWPVAGLLASVIVIAVLCQRRPQLFRFPPKAPEGEGAK